MTMSWLQRDQNAPLWQNMTVIPTCIMMPIWNMHFLFEQYLESLIYDDKDATNKPMKQATFHPIFDNKRFMEYAQIVVEYILTYPDLFMKKYIVMFAENLDMDWTCFIAVNAGFIRPIRGTHEENDPVCGFFLYNPIAEDLEFRHYPVQFEDPYLFFLTLAWFVVSQNLHNPE